MKKVFLGIDHPALAAKDVVALTKWYCDVFGYVVVAQTDKPIFLIKAPDGTCIEMMPEDGTPRPNRTVNTAGWSHLALRVNDMDKAMAALDGHQVHWEGAEFVPVGGGRIRNLSDPEGNLIQIVER